MVVIDESIYRALVEYRRMVATDRQMAEQLGLSATMVGRLLKRRSLYFADDTWARIKPLLSPYLRPYCPKGLECCPLDGGKALETLLHNVLSVSDGDAWYEHLNQIVEREKIAWKQS